MYDIVYIGAGISCLYSAYNYIKYTKNTNILILEKSNRIGGRIDWDIFENVTVVKGAGVGRFSKDKLLLNLLKELDIKYNIHRSSFNYIHPYNDNIIKNSLIKLYINPYNKTETFKEFALRILGKSDYELLINSLGYTDYESYDIKDALQNYGFEDDYKNNYIFIFSWKDLIEKLENILKKFIRLNSEVIAINNNSVNLKDEILLSKKIVLGVTKKPLLNLLPYDIYKNIESQPFIRIYALLNKKLPIDNYTIVGKPLQKIIPIKNNIYMIAYSDNENAILLKNSSKKFLQNCLWNIFGNEFKILKYIKYFHKEGTHLFKPLDSKYKSRSNYLKCAQNPSKNIYVIGEVVALKQGWVEGALKSTLKINLNEY